MLISVYRARDGCQRYKALHESAEPSVYVWLSTSVLLLGGFFVLIKNKDDLT